MVLLKRKQQEALNLMKKGKNVFLSGEAGTGKSFVIEQYIEYLKEKGKTYVVGAPTGLAAINVGGTTLHRMFGLSINLLDFNATTENIEEAEVVIIDEISMCRKDNFQKIIRAIKSFENSLTQYSIEKEATVCRKKQIIVVGDFYQLPPILGKKDKLLIQELKEKYGTMEDYGQAYKDVIELEEKRYAFECKEWDLLKFKSIVLDEVVRQSDKDYIDNLNKVRRGDVEGLEFIKKNSKKIKSKKAIYLCSLNKTVNDLNEENLSKLKEKAYTYRAIEEGELKEEDRATSQTLTFKVGARVMSVVNIKDEVANGMLGTVIELGENSVTVELDCGKTHEFKRYKWEVKGFVKVKEKGKDGQLREKIVCKEIGSFKQIPLKLAWAVTVHKSQGQTYDAVNFDPSGCFAEGQLYVALSRAKELKKLHMVEEIQDSHLKSSKVVEAFYKRIEREILEDDDEQEVATTVEIIDVEEFTEVEDTQVTEELFEEEKKEYVTVEVPKHLEETVLSLINNEYDTNIGNEEVVALKRQIKALEEQIERLQASSKRRPKISDEKELEIIRLRQSGISISRIAKMVVVGNGTVQRVLKENDIK